MSLGYRIMKNLLKANAVTQAKTKEELLDMCDVYFGAGRMKSEEYAEVVAEINAMP